MGIKHLNFHLNFFLQPPNETTYENKVETKEEAEELDNNNDEIPKNYFNALTKISSP